MKDGRDINYRTDEDGKNWIVDENGKDIRINGERIPGPAAIINPNEDFKVYDSSQGHCGLCFK
jgi:hypothetical protein